MMTGLQPPVSGRVTGQSQIGQREPASSTAPGRNPPQDAFGSLLAPQRAPYDPADESVPRQDAATGENAASAASALFALLLPPSAPPSLQAGEGEPRLPPAQADARQALDLLRNIPVPGRAAALAQTLEGGTAPNLTASEAPRVVWPPEVIPADRPPLPAATTVAVRGITVETHPASTPSHTPPGALAPPAAFPQPAGAVDPAAASPATPSQPSRAAPIDAIAPAEPRPSWPVQAVPPERSASAVPRAFDRDAVAAEAPRPLMPETGQPQLQAAPHLFQPATNQIAERILSASPPSATAAPASTSSPLTSASPTRVLTLQLEPVELGEVTIRLTMRHDRLDLVINATDARTAQLLRQDSEALTTMLSAAGYAVEGITIQAAVSDRAGAPSPPVSTAAAAEPFTQTEAAMAQTGADRGQGRPGGMAGEPQQRHRGEAGGEGAATPGQSREGEARRHVGSVYL